MEGGDDLVVEGCTGVGRPAPQWEAEMGIAR